MGVSGQKHEASLVGSGSPQTEELEQPADGSSNLPRATTQFGPDTGFRSTRLRFSEVFQFGPPEPSEKKPRKQAADVREEASTREEV